MSSFSTLFSNFLHAFGANEKPTQASNVEHPSLLQQSTAAKETLNELKKLENENAPENDYCAFVVDYYRSLGFIVWEYNKEAEHTQSEIHLIIKKEQEIFFIQCRNDNLTLNPKSIHNFEEQSQTLMNEHQIFSHYRVRLLYTMSSLQLDEKAYKYIKSSNNINYEIVKTHIN